MAARFFAGKFFQRFRGRRISDFVQIELKRWFAPLEVFERVFLEHTLSGDKETSCGVVSRFEDLGGQKLRIVG